MADEMEQALALDRQKLIDLGADPGPSWCERCQGNGEIVTDWEAYLHPPEGAPADAGVADCPDCDGAGLIRATLAGEKAEKEPTP